MLVEDEDDFDDELAVRMLAYVMSLPKPQRAAAYRKLFGRLPPEGALDDFSLDAIKPYAAPIAVAGAALAAYLLFFRKRGRR